MNKIDIENRNHYQYKVDNQSNAQTKSRLTQLIELGLLEYENASFGIPSVISGLYIEMVWTYTEKEWREYIDWINQRITDEALVWYSPLHIEVKNYLSQKYEDKLPGPYIDSIVFIYKAEELWM